MKTKILLMTTLLMSSISFANVAEEAQSHVDDITSFIDGIESSLIEAPQSRTALDLSDYQQARANFLQKVSESSANFKQCIAEIASESSSTIVGLDNHIANLRADVVVRSSSVLQELLQDKISARRRNLESLNETQTQRYQECLKKLLSLDENFKMLLYLTTTRGTKFRRLSYLLPPVGVIWELRDAIISSDRYRERTRWSQATPLSTSISYDLHNLFGGRYEMEYTRSEYNYGSGRRDVTHRTSTTIDEQTGFRHSMNSLIDSENRKKIRELFPECESSACEYLTLDDFLSWFEQIIDLNKDIELFDELELKSVDLPYNKRRMKRKVKKLLRRAVRNSVRG